jgi:putative cardiolipin synthase
VTSAAPQRSIGPASLGSRTSHQGFVVLRHPASRLLVLLAVAVLTACASTSLPRGEPGLALPPAQSGPLATAADGLGLAAGESAYRLVIGAEDAFAMRMRSAALAERSIDVQYYMWHDDLTGRLLAGELLAAARRGVRVRALLDDMYARNLDEVLANLDAHPNLEIRLFNPFRSRASTVGNLLEFVGSGGRQNRRMHNKLWIVDGRLAIVGGRNIGDEYFGAHDDFNFGDLGVLLAGRAVTECGASFDDYWNSEAVVPLSAFVRVEDPEAAVATAVAALDAHRASAATTAYVARLRDLGRDGRLGLHLEDMRRGRGVRVVADDPGKAFADDPPMRMLDEVRKLLGAATEEAVVVSPYFVPLRAGTDALVALQQRGVEVRILTNSLAANDVAAVHGGYSKWRRPLLRAGVSIHELKPDPAMPGDSALGESRASLHTKALVVDVRLAYVGSFNMDPRSARINTEGGVVIDDPVFAAQVRAQYERAIDPARSWRVELEGSQLRWYDVRDGQPVVSTGEPQADTGRKVMSWLFRILPLDGQL